MRQHHGSSEPTAQRGLDAIPTRARVLIADGTPIVRSGVRGLLTHERDFEPSEAVDLASMLATVARERPDIALIDMELPPFGAVYAIKRLREVCRPHVIVWSSSPRPDEMLAAISAGAIGCLPKDISPEGLLSALRGIARGEAPFARSMMTMLVESVHGLAERSEARERTASLSSREREVLKLIASGLDNKHVAEALCLSVFTVKRHVQNILEKLDVPSRRAAAGVYGAAALPDELVEAQEMWA